MEDLSGLTEVVRRVIRARVDRPHLVDDLTQETLLHVAAADGLTADERQAYAITTARNLVTDHARREAVQERHLHRLVESSGRSGPEQAALEQEQTAALAEALEQLPVSDRTLLVRHEVDGDSIELLAAEHHASSRALANRLARARATLRVEFVLAYRRVQLPTVACRPVLLALSAGDRRRQHQLDARRHLEHCPVCAELAGPITRRRRGIAAWLLLPIADAARRIARSLRHNHWTQAAGATAVAAGAVTALVVSRPDVPASDTSATSPASSALGTSAAPTPPTTVPTQPTCPPAAPLDRSTSPPPVGCAIAPTTFTAVQVPADEGFWAQDATGGSVWIQLAGTGESPFDITAGTTLTASGVITDPNSAPEVAADGRTAARGFILTVRYEDLVLG